LHFKNETIGVTPAGWVPNTGASTNTPPLVANAINHGGWSPSIKVLDFPTSAATGCYYSHQFPRSKNIVSPEPLVFNNGFRAAAWIGYNTDNPAGTQHGFLSGPYISGTANNGITAGPWRASPYNVERYSYVNGTGTAIGSAVTVTQFTWNIFQWEYNHTTNQLTITVRRWVDGGIHWGPVTATCNAGLPAAFTSLSAYYHIGQKNDNVYLRGTQLGALWVGYLTDSFPAYNAPQGWT
jgi:hypothetical protein